MASPNHPASFPTCAVCKVQLTQADRMADNHVYKLGDLHYIELAHVACVKDLPVSCGWGWAKELQQGPWDPDPDHNDRHANYETHSGTGEYNPMYGNCDVLGQTEW